jgi:hypothetical protein
MRSLRTSAKERAAARVETLAAAATCNRRFPPFHAFWRCFFRCYRLAPVLKAVKSLLHNTVSRSAMKDACICFQLLYAHTKLSYTVWTKIPSIWFQLMKIIFHIAAGWTTTKCNACLPFVLGIFVRQTRPLACSCVKKCTSSAKQTKQRKSYPLLEFHLLTK